ncbi:hypothetical protein MF672_010765 [Actinomadura sp. ATCC 31491]|uniref:Uncharacterized protein n=1 Tax=Actinomadura luzonensis TaxID=2805427 RepID=A0ABT0FPJ3_9ACTN|nr:hypothetical protein [Actinomadura luzonensis]MCK2214268.1 hypothetical protein [Actinomadura luzonensis]
MSAQLPIWELPAPPRRRHRWQPRCDDCGRRVRATESLRVGPDGKRRGDKCRRAYNRARRRLVVPMVIVVRDPGHIPGQGEIELPRAGP